MDTNENQLNRVYDFETGVELTESAEGAKEVYEQEILDQAMKVEAMQATPGWKLIEEFCFNQIESGKDKLVDAKDLETIRRIQSQITAFSHLLGSVNALIREATQIRESKSKDGAQAP